MTQPPRADVLWYPRHRWPTVLVRRTHDVAAARALAEQRWAQVRHQYGDAPLSDRHRIGWWIITPRAASTSAAGALDQYGRAVVLVTDPDTTPNAGAGVEFRP